jgi:hypothetical protein
VIEVVAEAKGNDALACGARVIALLAEAVFRSVEERKTGS